jgi:hypothetical protein
MESNIVDYLHQIKFLSQVSPAYATEAQHPAAYDFAKVQSPTRKVS